MVVNSLGFVLPHISRLGDEEAGNQETPTGADKKAPKKILLSLTKEPRKGEPHKPSRSIPWVLILYLGSTCPKHEA